MRDVGHELNVNEREQSLIADVAPFLLVVLRLLYEVITKGDKNSLW